jgi:hypothetical protein
VEDLKVLVLFLLFNLLIDSKVLFSCSHFQMHLINLTLFISASFVCMGLILHRLSHLFTSAISFLQSSVIHWQLRLYSYFFFSPSYSPNLILYRVETHIDMLYGDSVETNKTLIMLMNNMLRFLFE